MMSKVQGRACGYAQRRTSKSTYKVRVRRRSTVYIRIRNGQDLFLKSGMLLSLSRYLDVPNFAFAISYSSSTNLVTMRGSALLLLWHLASLAAAATSISRVVELDGRDYFLPPISPWSLKLNSSDRGDDIIPFTVVQTNASHITAQILLAALEQYNRTDDVWMASFASGKFTESGWIWPACRKQKLI